MRISENFTKGIRNRTGWNSETIKQRASKMEASSQEPVDDISLLRALDTALLSVGDQTTPEVKDAQVFLDSVSKQLDGAKPLGRFPGQKTEDDLFSVRFSSHDGVNGTLYIDPDLSDPGLEYVVVRDDEKLPRLSVLETYVFNNSDKSVDAAMKTIESFDTGDAEAWQVLGEVGKQAGQFAENDPETQSDYSGLFHRTGDAEQPATSEGPAKAATELLQLASEAFGGAKPNEPKWFAGTVDMLSFGSDKETVGTLFMENCTPSSNEFKYAIIKH